MTRYVITVNVIEDDVVNEISVEVSADSRYAAKKFLKSHRPLNRNSFTCATTWQAVDI